MHFDGNYTISTLGNIRFIFAVNQLKRQITGVLALLAPARCHLAQALNSLAGGSAPHRLFATEVLDSHEVCPRSVNDMAFQELAAESVTRSGLIGPSNHI